MEPTSLAPVYVDENATPSVNNEVSLGVPAEAPDTSVSLSGPGPVPVQLPDAVASKRAKKIQEGIGEHISKTTEEIKQEINSGREQSMRELAARKMDEINSNLKMQQAIDMANAKGGPLSEAEVMHLMDPYNPLNKPLDPDSIVERQYGQKYIGTIQRAIDSVKDNPVKAAQEEIPEQVNEAFLKGSVLASKMEYAKKIKQDMQALVGQQSYVGVAADAIKQMFQPYNELKMRGNVPDVGYLEGGDLGSNMQAQADKLFGLPFDEFAKGLKAITDGLSKDNPQLAVRFAEYVEGLPITDRVLDGAFTYMLPLDAASIAKMGKSGVAIARKISLNNRANEAVKQFVKVADKVGADAAARAEATGDLAKATELRATENILQDMNGTSDPMKIATDDSLLTMLNQDKEKLATNTGSLTTTQVVKIQDAYDKSGQTLLQRIVDSARINRIPMPLAVQNAVNIVREAAKAYYPGLRNAILDVSNPLYEPKSNTYWHDITFGNIGGTLFSNPDTAKNFAKLHGFNDIKVIEGAGQVTNREIEKMLERKAAVEKNVIDWEQTVIRRKKEAGDKKLTVQDRAEAKSQAEGIQEQIKIAKAEADDLDLKLRGKATYDRVRILEAETDLLRSKNKELRATLKQPEKIKTAAIKVDGKIFTGGIHGDAVDKWLAENPNKDINYLNKDTFSDGYLTNTGRYVSRDEAAGIATKQKQLKPSAKTVNIRGENVLVAEDVKPSTTRGESITPEVRSHIEEYITWAEGQIKANAQELNAIRQNKASVVGTLDTVEQHGVGFKIVIRRPLVETDKAVRDLMIRDASGKLIPEAISTSSQTGFKSLINAAVGKLRGADDTLALNESINRKIGTYTQSLFKEWAQQEASYIRQVASGVIRTDPVTGETIPYWKAKPIALWNKVTLQTRKTYDEFVRVLDHARDARDPDTGQVGYFFKTPGELNNHYLQYYDRSPSFAEHEGYFAFVRMVEGDRIWREIAEFRNRARLGTEQVSISAMGPNGKMVNSGFFDAIPMKNFPGGDDVMMIMSKRLGEEKLVNLGGAGLTPKQIETYKEMVEQGKLRVLRVYAPEHRPLRDFSDVAGNERVRYVLTDAAETKQLDFNHVNRRGGGHFEYDYDNFLKQANMYHQYESGIKGRFRSVYTGDTTFMPLLNRVMGRDIANKMHVIQDLIKSGDIEGAKRYTQAHLPIEWDELYSMFKPSKDANGKVVPARLSLEEKFYVVPKGGSIYGLNKDLEIKYGKAFKDGTRSGSDNAQFQVAFNTERESTVFSHVEDIGTQGNPLYRYAPESKRVDPITTMNRSLNRITNSVFMDDYKIYAVEHWLREAGTHLKASSSDIESSPFYHFQDASTKAAFKPNTPPEVVRNLLSNRYKIQQFVGVPNSVDTAVHTATQWLVDSAYQRFGPEAARSIGEKAITIVPQWMLAHIRDPITFMRSMTFHAKLGLWAVPQILVQSQTFATIISVSPFHGTAGTYATMLHTWSRMNSSPEVLRALDNMATKLNVFGQSKWRAGEFTEAREALNRVGFEKVAGEYANLNTALKTDFVGNDLKSIANAGTVFFREGEKATRLGAWYTAFREFREVNPTGAVTRSDLGKILQRADLLTVNMSRASNSMLHGGFLSLTTQFLTYQLRLAELFMGTRLGATTTERNMARLRMLTFYSALYGAPSAVGLSGLPLANTIREEAIKRGYVVGENFLSTLVDQGLPAMTLAMLTGGGDFKKGNNYNVGDRFGSPGFTVFNEALKSDTPWYKLLAGASGTTLLNTLTQGSNFWRAAASFLQPNNKDKMYPLKVDDFIDLFKEITSVNQAWKIYAAINTGKWMSKNEAYIQDVSKANAVFMGLTGMSPQQQDDIYIKSNIRKGEVEFQKHIMKEFIQEYRRYLAAARDGNPKQAQDYARRADTMLEIGGFPADKKATLLAIAAKGYTSQIKEQDFSFAFKNVPSTRSDFLGIPMPFKTQTNIPDVRRDQFRRSQQLETYKGQ